MPFVMVSVRCLGVFRVCWRKNCEQLQKGETGQRHHQRATLVQSVGLAGLLAAGSLFGNQLDAELGSIPTAERQRKGEGALFLFLCGRLRG